MSRIRKIYFARLAGRVFILALCVLHFLTRPEIFEPLEGMRFFAGYAEWAPGQLNEEIEQGDWFVTPALPSDIIAPGRVDIWGDVMRRQAMPLPLYSTFPSDPSDN